MKKSGEPRRIHRHAPNVVHDILEIRKKENEQIILMENKMNRLFKNVLAVIAIALLISLAAAAMGSSYGLALNRSGTGLATSQVICADPNEPGDIPEMVPNSSAFRVLSTQYYELSTNFISEDPNDEPAEIVVGR